MGVEPKIGVPQNGWFIMEIRIKIFDGWFIWVLNPKIGVVFFTTQIILICFLGLFNHFLKHPFFWGGKIPSPYFWVCSTHLIPIAC